MESCVESLQMIGRSSDILRKGRNGRFEHIHRKDVATWFHLSARALSSDSRRARLLFLSYSPPSVLSKPSR